MAVHQTPRHTRFRFLTAHGPTTALSADGVRSAAVVTGWLARGAATARILLGFVFLWAFFDKAFGWGYATQSTGAWIDGGSPTKGFLGNVAVGPFQSTFRSWTGDAWADWLFMLGLLGIGLALTAGIALRLAATAGTVMMALMWAAEWPWATHLADGSPSMSSNPVVDYHVLYAVVMIVLALAAAGRTWGLGRIWQELPFVRSNRWLF
ncbi:MULTISPECIES: DoxX family membrane protein [unclassified Streptomyces]|uniref:DoxX family membrane protein n=1 Tax=unclassified Streptomyces TaxID=2593676 RepID=UPI00081F0F9D|nr:MULTISPECIES: DoxX family membrane protein [unclassified Streptomyces]MYZ37213.1 DoxX family membrane protein [Streptomyces sp. SID4917]SCF89642.1 thiosulfate dehydrogenase [quinone] large subunit [Streptomyces sp. MnatMP-M17]